MEGELLKAMLASEGIQAHLVGAHLAGAVGELPACGLLGMLVEDADAERARWLIGEYNGAQPLPGDEPDNVQGVLLC
jgi:hypothetical protein